MRTIRILGTLLFRPIVIGRENIPKTGAVLIAPVHRSNVDFAFSVFMSRRKIFFMAKDSLYKIKPIGKFLLHLGAFPVTRDSADRDSMAASEYILQQGQALILFPEGTRKQGPVIEQLRDGAMFIASRTNSVVVPVGIGGSDKSMKPGAKFPRPVRIKIVIGKPIAPPTAEGRVSRSAISAKTEELQKALQDVYDQSLRA
ncbi:MAG: lysophospholipid acyltransferase family protein [Acidimicrobiaceae bacterium]